MSLLVQRCCDCDALSFPARLLCGQCGSSAAETVEIASGVVEECVQVFAPHQITLAQLRLSPDLTVIATINGLVPERGAELPIMTTSNVDGPPHAYVPQATSAESSRKATQ